MMGGGFGSSPIELQAADASLRGEIYCMDFTYAATWATGTASALGANATVDQQIQVNSDADFVVQSWNFTALTAAGTFIAIPDYLLLVTVAGSGRQLMSQAQMIANFCGSYQNDRVPGIASYPLLLTANTTVTCSLQNRTGTAANLAALTLRGFKVFYTGGNRSDIFHVM